MDVYSTADAPRHSRTAWWNSVYTGRFAPVTFNPADREGFEAELRVGALGPLGIARVHCMSAEIERRRANVTAHRDQLFSFLAIRRGTGSFSQYGHQVTLEAGDLTLCDSSVPHCMECSDATDILIVRVRPELLRTHLPVPEQVCGLKLDRAALFADVATHMLRSVWRHCETGVPDQAGASMARNLLDVLATSYAASFAQDAAESCVVTARRLQAQRFIEAHLRDHDLTAASVARSLQVSTRYLRKLYDGQDESLARYVLRRRLEECARRLASTLWSGHTVTQIAFDCGFNSAEHFTRAFRGHFGTTPTDFRRRRARERLPESAGARQAV